MRPSLPAVISSCKHSLAHKFQLMASAAVVCVTIAMAVASPAFAERIPLKKKGVGTFKRLATPYICLVKTSTTRLGVNYRNTMWESISVRAELQKLDRALAKARQASRRAAVKSVRAAATTEQSKLASKRSKLVRSDTQCKGMRRNTPTPTPSSGGGQPPGGGHTPTPTPTPTPRRSATPTPTMTPTPTPTPVPLCSDGIDNNGDGLTDYPADPICDSAQSNAESSTNNTVARGVKAFAWSTVPTQATDYVKPFVWLWGRKLTEPAQTASRIMQMPVNERVVYVWDTADETLGEDNPPIHVHPDDRHPDPETHVNYQSLFWDNGVAHVANMTRAYFTDLASRGVAIDVVAIDFEEYYYQYMAWGLFQCGQPMTGFDIPCDQVSARLRSFQDHPRFNAELLAPLQARGFQWVNNSLEDSLKTGAPLDNRAIWDFMMYERVVQWLTEAYADPIHDIYPNAQMLNYGFAARDARFHHPERGGAHWYRQGSIPGFGTTASPSMYGYMAAWVFRVYPYGSQLVKNPYNTLLIGQNDARIAKFSGQPHFAPWIPDNSYSAVLTTATAEYPTPQKLYDENVFHLLTLGAEYLMYWNADGASSDAGEIYLRNLIAEYNLLTAAATNRSDVETEVFNLDQDAMVTCTFANRYLCRYTPANLQPAGTLTQTASGVRVTYGDQSLLFPRAVIISLPGSPSTAGAWIAGPERPVVYSGG